MIVTLIPLFLAASIGVNENDWKYGPEVVWDLKVISVSLPFRKIDGIANMKMYCRPKTNFTMMCRLHHTNEMNNVTEMTEENESTRESNDHQYFEMNFDDNGISSIGHSPWVDPKAVRLLKALVGGFNIRANFSMETTNQPENSESWIRTRCKTDYIRTLKDTSENNDKTKKPYEISLLPEMKSLKGEIKDVKRTVNLNNCIYLIDNIFGIWDNQQISKPKLISGHAHMTIKEREYTLTIENTIIVSTKFSPDRTTIVQTITLSLADIVPARGPMPIINFSKLRVDSSEDMSNSESQDSSEDKINESQNTDES